LNQEITLSRNVVRYWYENPPLRFSGISNVSQIEDYIKENKIVIDSKEEFINILKSEILNLNITNKDELKNFEEGLLSLIHNKADTVIQNINEKTFEHKLSASSNDKIIFDPLVHDEEFETLSIRLNINLGVELHNVSSFIKPNLNNRLKHNRTYELFDLDYEYDILNLFKPYLSNATEITIIDPFIVNPIAFSNFKKISKLFLNNSTLNIYFYSNNTYKTYRNNESIRPQNHDPYKKFYEQIDIFKNRNITVNLNELRFKEHYDRYIITNQTIIEFPGLDFIKDNKINVKSVTNEINFIEKNKKIVFFKTNPNTKDFYNIIISATLPQ